VLSCQLQGKAADRVDSKEKGMKKSSGIQEMRSDGTFEPLIKPDEASTPAHSKSTKKKV
jgi:hypothetical protein